MFCSPLDDLTFENLKKLILGSLLRLVAFHDKPCISATCMSMRFESFVQEACTETMKALYLSGLKGAGQLQSMPDDRGATHGCRCSAHWCACRVDREGRCSHARGNRGAWQVGAVNEMTGW